MLLIGEAADTSFGCSLHKVSIHHAPYCRFTYSHVGCDCPGQQLLARWELPETQNVRELHALQCSIQNHQWNMAEKFRAGLGKMASLECTRCCVAHLLPSVVSVTRQCCWTWTVEATAALHRQLLPHVPDEALAKPQRMLNRCAQVCVHARHFTPVNPATSGCALKAFTYASMQPGSGCTSSSHMMHRSACESSSSLLRVTAAPQLTCTHTT